jgi:hypothetical protein
MLVELGASNHRFVFCKGQESSRANPRTGRARSIRFVLRVLKLLGFFMPFFTFGYQDFGSEIDIRPQNALERIFIHYQAQPKTVDSIRGLLFLSVSDLFV